MPRPKNAMEIFKLLDKSNCRECGEKTCLAFAGAVFMGQKKLEACPKLDHATLDRFSAPSQSQASSQLNSGDDLLTLKKKIATLFTFRVAILKRYH